MAIDHRYGATSWCYRSHTIILMWSHTMDKCVSAVGTGWMGGMNRMDRMDGTFQYPDVLTCVKV
jgi:hypothetical protein